MNHYIFRNIKLEEIEQVVEIEQICFPPHEACSRKNMVDRVQAACDYFLVALDPETNKIVGFLNGIATNETRFQDEFFTDANLHDSSGENIMLCGLDVLPEYRGKGLARELVRQYVLQQQFGNKKSLYLTCLEKKVSMYEKFGFIDNGIADSTWGNEEWHEMYMEISKK